MKLFLRVVLVAVVAVSGLMADAQYIEFVENKGQWDSHVKFQGNLPNGAFLLQNNGYRVVLHKAEDLSKLYEVYHGHSHSDHHSTAAKAAAPAPPANGNSGVTVRSHAYEVKFLYANPNPTVIAEKAQPGYNNYFLGNDPSKWASECKIYNTVVYKNMYPGIDVRYYTGGKQLKYDIIVHPGADISRLALSFDGVDELRVKNQELVIKTTVQEVKELKPYSYQIQSAGKREIRSSYSVRGNIVRFQLQEYDKNSTLVIDPEIWFSTFTGSLADNWGYTATYDAEGNFYAGGIVFGPGFPVSNGAFQQTYQGGTGEPGNSGPYDIAIMKFNASGSTRLYATYLGGSNGNEQPHSLVADNNGNLVIAGRTSSSNYPVTLSTHGPGGKYDILITKLNAAGTALIASRKFGGTGDDGVNIAPKGVAIQTATIRRNYGDDARSEVIFDNQGNICLASCTQSTDFLTVNAVQTTNGGGSRSQDAVIIKTSADIATVIQSTYLGGDGDDAAFVLGQNINDGSLYVGGATTSTNLPSTAGVLSTSYNGGLSDGFIAVLNNNALTKLTYVGTNGADIIFGLKFDRFGFPYITGTTTGQWPIVNSPYNAGGNQVNAKQFICKINQDLSSWVYSTTFGKNATIPSISIIAFLVDRCENVYVSGWGGSINGNYIANQTTLNMPVTPDAYMGENKADGSDFYFFVLEKNANKMLYGSYFGQTGGMGEHVDGGTSRFDANGVIYQALCANCNDGGPKPPFPTTPGAWSMNNGSENCNLAAVKMAFNLAGVGSSVKAFIKGVADNRGCLPLSVEFKDTIATAKRFIWNFGDGSAEQVTTTPSITHLYNQVGNFQVRLISIDSTTCNISDTSYTTIRVGVDEALPDFTYDKTGPCEQFTYVFTNTTVPIATKPFKPNSFVWDFGDGTRLVAGAQQVTHSFATAGTYNVRLVLVDTNYCNSPDSIQKTLRVAENVKAQFEVDSVGCAPYTAVFNNITIAGQNFTWYFGDGTTSTDVNPTHEYTNIGTYTVKLIARDDNTCNKVDSISFSIRVSDKPDASFTYSPNPPLPNKAIEFTNNTLGANRYKWLFGDGDSLITIRKDTIVRYEYNEGKLYNVCLIAYNNVGCTDTTCQEVQAKVIPVYDIPTAFTPNGDGVNDYVTVKGFGIKKVLIRIYNRWGNLLFESNNFKQGWNGTVKGVLQPQDVYTYIIDVEFFDGNREQKKGDITLLR